MDVTTIELLYQTFTAAAFKLLLVCGSAFIPYPISLP